MKDIIKRTVIVDSIVSAYEALKQDVINTAELEDSFETLVLAALSNDLEFCEPEFKSNAKGESVGFLGRILINESTHNEVNNKILEYFDCTIENGKFSVPLYLDYENGFSVLVEDETEDVKAISFIEEILLKILKHNPRMNFRCGDFGKLGHSFSELYGLISQLSDRSGGMIYSKKNGSTVILDDLEKVIQEALTRLGATGMTVYSYNMEAEQKLAEYVVLLRLEKSMWNQEEIDRLRSAIINGKRAGFSFLISADEEIFNALKDIVDINMVSQKGDLMIAAKEPLIFNRVIQSKSITEMIDEIILSSQNINKIETKISNLSQIGFNCQQMDATDILRIPFAYDKYGKLQYFEIGGEAPTHALISGSTGSGKSVALHTLIMQIIYNYHPDDVEIWAIDYKAVEFNTYMTHKTPHFRVIAHDTSTEFSLSLLDLLYEEYNSRMNSFLREGVKNIKEYREKCGAHSMPRIVVFIDEFQLMTQAVQVYTGNTDYRTILENLLRLTRAMGISFVLCSQTIASGLSGLTDSARDQIGGRLSLKHDDENEIRETLMLGTNSDRAIGIQAKNLRRGEGIYKRTRLSHEDAVDGSPYEFKHVHILFHEDDLKSEIINEINDLIREDYQEKKTIYVRGGGRIEVSEKERHPLMRFLNDTHIEDDVEGFSWYPAGPTTLADKFLVEIEPSSGVNMLMVGENDDLRDSIIFHSLLGFLMNPNNKVYANFLDEDYSDRRRIIDIIKNIKCDRLIINEGVIPTMKAIEQLRKMKPLHGENQIYLWYGLEKLKNEIFLLEQEDAQPEVIPEENELSKEDMINDLKGFLALLNGEDSETRTPEQPDQKHLTHEECVKILKRTFEMGSENGYYHMAIFNNYKALKRCNLISLADFENRIGTKMSADDSFELFGSSLAMEKADENTAVFYTGSGKVIPLRPYLMPTTEWLKRYNEALCRNQR